MTDELEKLQRKGTKPTCPHCQATVLSTSQPERTGMDNVPRAEFEIVRNASRMFEDASNAWMERALKAEAALAATPAADAIDAIQGALALYLKEVQPVDGRAQINISLNELNVLRSLAATPAVGGEPVEWHWRTLDDGGKPTSKWFVVDGSLEEFERDMEADSYELRPLFAAQPASPYWAWNKKGDPIGLYLPHEAAKVAFHAGARWASAPPPEQPAAAPLPWIDAEEGDMS